MKNDKVKVDFKATVFKWMSCL